MQIHSHMKRYNRLRPRRVQKGLLSPWRWGVPSSQHTYLFTSLKFPKARTLGTFMVASAVMAAVMIGHELSTACVLSGGWQVGLNVPRFSSWLDLFGEQPASRSPPGVSSAEQKIL